MNKLVEYWKERSGGQKGLILAAFAATFLAVAGFAWLANRTPMAMLYSGLDSSRAGEVMAELDKTGVASEIRGDAIWVDADQRDVLAMPIEVDGAAHAPTCGALAWSAMRQRSAKGAIMSFTVAAAAALPPQSKIT